MLRELTIENYRCFEKLHVKDLAQVNLIVGKNNVGKTSFLEAVYLYVSHGGPKEFLELLSARELTYEPIIYSEEISANNYYPVDNIFRVSNQNPQQSKNFSIDSDNLFKLEASLAKWDGNRQELTSKLRPGFQLEFLISRKDNPHAFPREVVVFVLSPTMILDSASFSIPVLEDFDQNTFAKPHHFIDARGLGFEALRKLWDEIILTPEENHLEDAMKILEPRLEKIGFVSRQSSLSSIKIRIKGDSTPIPLSSLGDGMRRLMGIAMSLAVSKSGYLVIDEIDMGLHYKVQESMWRLVLETAKRLNVQVFATTHSWDCIAAFQSAMEEMEDPTIGKLIRLDARGDELRAIEYDAEDLEVAVSHGIEVR
jgi:predicted ATP-dependent endonuclease of OLD family